MRVNLLNPITTLRKKTKCAICGYPIPKGEQAWKHGGSVECQDCSTWGAGLIRRLLGKKRPARTRTGSRSIMRSGSYYSWLPSFMSNPATFFENLGIPRAARPLMSRTISQEVKAGYPLEQAVAVAYSKARRAGFKIPGKANPMSGPLFLGLRSTRKRKPKKSAGRKKVEGVLSEMRKGWKKLAGNPKSEAILVECLECGKKFSTRSMIPTCPRCGGSDIDVRSNPEGICQICKKKKDLLHSAICWACAGKWREETKKMKSKNPKCKRCKGKGRIRLGQNIVTCPVCKGKKNPFVYRSVMARGERKRGYKPFAKISHKLAKRVAPYAVTTGRRKNPKPVKIYTDVEKVFAHGNTTAGNPKSASFYHDFGRGVEAFGMPDGSIKLKSRVGRKLWTP